MVYCRYLYWRHISGEAGVSSSSGDSGLVTSYTRDLEHYHHHHYHHHHCATPGVYPPVVVGKVLRVAVRQGDGLAAGCPAHLVQYSTVQYSTVQYSQHTLLMDRWPPAASSGSLYTATEDTEAGCRSVAGSAASK